MSTALHLSPAVIAVIAGLVFAQTDGTEISDKSPSVSAGVSQPLNLENMQISSVLSSSPFLQDAMTKMMNALNAVVPPHVMEMLGSPQVMQAMGVDATTTQALMKALPTSLTDSGAMGTLPMMDAYAPSTANDVETVLPRKNVFVF